MNLCGWGLRAALLIVFAAITFIAPPAFRELILPLLLVGWLSSGICSPVAGSGRKKGPKLSPRPLVVLKGRARLRG